MLKNQIKLQLTVIENYFLSKIKDPLTKRDVLDTFRDLKILVEKLDK